ncbi:MAG: HD domain-containing protein [Alcanivorax sp.]|nr:HD domain-containing protein [Alcanivorax sp.]
MTELKLVDDLFDQYSERFGKQQSAYRNHVYRVINLVSAQHSLSDEELEKVQIAGFFHDAGIWLAGTFDYLEPSARLAEHYLEEHQRDHWKPEIRDMILNHHKVSRYATDTSSLVEAFRRADWIDVSLGVLRYGVPMARIRLIKQKFPNTGFHLLLLKLSGQQLLSHPWRPLPMLRR